jgi:hypothetical protein
MSVGMGVENQGGPVIGVLASPPKPTVELGAVMRHEAGAGAEHAGHRMPADSVARLADTLARVPNDAVAKERLVNALFQLLDDQAVQQRVAATVFCGARLDLIPVIPKSIATITGCCCGHRRRHRHEPDNPAPGSE